jgi:uncharacterized protein
MTKKNAILLLLFVLIHYSVKSQDSKTIADGYNAFYYPNGQVSSEGMMVEGKPEGYWKTYYVTGILKSEGNRKNFLLDSIWVFYSPSGDTLEKISYMYGKKNGYTYSYKKPLAGIPSKSGNVIAKELFINDKKEGKSFYYYDTGELKETIDYSGGKKEGRSIEYDRNALPITLMEYRNDQLIDRVRINRVDNNGLKQGTWMEFYPDGTIRTEANYINNQLDGIYRQYERDGTITMIMYYNEGIIREEETNAEMPVEIRQTVYPGGKLKTSGAFRENIPVGIHRSYDEQGNVIATVIYDQKGRKTAQGVVNDRGERMGKWTDFYPGGSKKAEGEYRDNRRSGEWIFFSENSGVVQQGNYRNGLYHGTWQWYYPDGKILREEEYFNGREDGISTEYSEEGEIIARGDYVEGEKEGEWVYTVGDHTEKGKYLVGLREGVWKHFYADGSLRFEGNYFQGNPDGRHTLYYPNGNIMEEQFFVKGIMERNWKKYDEEGNLLLTITYKSNREHRINGIKTGLPERRVTLIR